MRLLMGVFNHPILTKSDLKASTLLYQINNISIREVVYVIGLSTSIFGLIPKQCAQ